MEAKGVTLHWDNDHFTKMVNFVPHLGAGNFLDVTVNISGTNNLYRICYASITWFGTKYIIDHPIGPYAAGSLYEIRVFWDHTNTSEKPVDVSLKFTTVKSEDFLTVSRGVATYNCRMYNETDWLIRWNVLI